MDLHLKDKTRSCHRLQPRLGYGAVALLPRAREGCQVAINQP